jgi:hypothetical protein
MGKADALRRLIREEVKRAIREEMPNILKELAVETKKPTMQESAKKEYNLPLTLNKKPKKPVAPSFGSNNPLAKLLNETATSMVQNAEEPWPTISMNTENMDANPMEYLTKDTAAVGDVTDMLSSSKRASAIEMTQINAVPDFNHLMDKLISKGQM